MARLTRAASHLTAEEAKHRMQTDPHPWRRQRWLIIYNALVDPRKAEDIAKHCGVSKATVHQVISSYNRFGGAAVQTPGKGGRHHDYLSVQEEQALLAPFFARAEQGELATAGEIKHAFEARIGHVVPKSTIYRLLDRHDWRKIMPRPRHPKASQEEQEQFKKFCDAGSGGSRNAPTRRHQTRPGHGTRRGTLWPHLASPQLLGASPLTACLPCPGSTGVYLRLCGCRPNARADDRLGTATSRYRHDELFPGACFAHLCRLFHCHASGSGRMAPQQGPGCA